MEPINTKQPHPEPFSTNGHGDQHNSQQPQQQQESITSPDQLTDVVDSSPHSQPTPSQPQPQVMLLTLQPANVTLQVNPMQTIAEIKRLAEEQYQITLKRGLVYDGKPLDDTKTLADHGIHGAQVELRLQTVKKSKKRCTFGACISAPLRGVGDCSFCEGHFCSKHRLLEQHKCVGLINCKQALHEKNAVKLQQQQTVSNKV